MENLFASNAIFALIFIAFCIGFLFYRYLGRVYIIPNDQFIVVMKSRFVEFVFTSVKLAIIPRPWDVVKEFPWNGIQYKRSLQVSSQDGVKITFPKFLVKMKILDVQQSLKAPSFKGDRPGLSADQVFTSALNEIEAAIEQEAAAHPYFTKMYEGGVINVISPGVMNAITTRIQPSYGTEIGILWGEPVISDTSKPIVDQYRQDRATAEAQRKRLKFDKAQRRLYGRAFPLIVAIQNVVQGKREAAERMAQAIEKARPDSVTWVEGPATDLSAFADQGKPTESKRLNDKITKATTEMRNQALVVRPIDRNNVNGGNNAGNTGLRAEDFE